jgi:hypothetical protein
MVGHTSNPNTQEAEASWKSASVSKKTKQNKKILSFQTTQKQVTQASLQLVVTTGYTVYHHYPNTHTNWSEALIHTT